MRARYELLVLRMLGVVLVVLSINSYQKKTKPFFSPAESIDVPAVGKFHPKMGLVGTWLNGIGLSHAVPTFTAAGIVTPTALAELNVAHFEALGVTDPEDRRKLFYLVQRIKLAVDQKDETAEKVDAVLSKSNPQQRGGGGGGVEKKKNLSVTTTTNTTSSNNNGHPSVTRKSLSAIENGNGPHQEEYSDDASTEVDNGESDSYYDDGCADDEASSRNLVRRSKRIQAKHVNNNNNSSGSSNNNNNATTTAAGGRTTPRTPKMSSGRSIPAPGGRTTTTSSSSRRKSSLQKSSSSSRLQDNSDSASDCSPKRTRKTGIQGPRTRRNNNNNNNPSRSTRTGKRLSTIPSDSIAPMSPLLAIPNSKLDAEIKDQEQAATANAATNNNTHHHSRRNNNNNHHHNSSDYPSSLSGNESAHNSGKSSSDSEKKSSVSSRRSSSSRSRSRSRTRNGYGSDSSEKKTKSSGHVKSKLNKNSKASSQAPTTPLKDSSKSIENIPPATTGRVNLPSSFSKSSNDLNSSVVVHGMGEPDESWKEQISRLREDLEAEYELFERVVLSDLELEDMRIRVAVRKRPMSVSEAKVSGNIDIIHPLDYGCYGRIMVYQPKRRVDLTKEIECIPFAFDNIFDDSQSNVDIYDRAIRNLIPSFFEGQWGTIFAYGQTGSGKTYTMMGSSLTGINDGSVLDESNFGLYYLAAIDIFDILQKPENGNLSLGVSLFEIYGGKLIDLLSNRNPVKCLEDSRGKVCFPGLSEHPLSSPEELMELIEQGANNRSTGCTSKNAHSSRSHAVLQLHLRKSMRRRHSVEHSRLTFIDLAGNERGADTYHSSHATRMEGAEINTSLLALKEVIRALATGDSMTHVPFRGSKLTQVLKEGFVGKNSTSVMIACISPDIGNCEQTLNTLRYADRVKERNAETGALSVATRNRGRRRTAQHPSASFVADTDVSYSTYMDDNVSESDKYRRHTYAPGADDLDDLLGQSDEEGNGENMFDDLLDSFEDNTHEKVEKQVPKSVASETTEKPVSAGITEKPISVGELVDQHKAVMSSMLGMVKDEMAIVNKADSDRDNLEQYLVNLDNIQQKQLSLISGLRQSINRYSNQGDIDITKAEGGNELLTDDSFEDLRD